VFLMSALERRLRLLATLFGLRQLRARRTQFALRLRDLCIGRAGGGTQRLQAMLAPEHARARIRSPAHPQPVPPDPFALARDERVSLGSGRATRAEHPRGMRPSQHRGEPRADRRGTLRRGRRASPRGPTRCRAAALDERDAAGCERAQRARHFLQALDAYGPRDSRRGRFRQPAPSRSPPRVRPRAAPRREPGLAPATHPPRPGMVGERLRLQSLERGELGGAPPRAPRAPAPGAARLPAARRAAPADAPGPP